MTNLANCAGRQKNPALAELYYQAVLRFSPHSHVFPHATLDFLDVESRSLYLNTLNTKEAFEDAQSNLAFTYLNMNNAKKEEEVLRIVAKQEVRSSSKAESKIDYAASLRQVILIIFMFLMLTSYLLSVSVCFHMFLSVSYVFLICFLFVFYVSICVSLYVSYLFLCVS